MRKALYILGIFLLIAIIAFWQFISAISGELIVNEEFEQWLLKTFGGNYILYVYGISVVGFIIIGISVVYGIFKDRLPGSLDEKEDVPLEKELFEIARTNQRKVCQERLDQKIANRYPVNLEMEDTQEGSPDLGRLYNKTIEPGDPGNDILNIYQNAREKLLIIGEPGAGKTTVLLQLAIQLVDAQPAKIPVVIDMATWRPRFRTVEEWLIELLPQDGFNSTMAKKVVDDQLITPLFDGLDELKEEDREGCLEAIKIFGRPNGITFVITSRISEYKATGDAPVEGQVVVKPLTLTQIRYSIRGTEASGLLDAINRDEYFRKAMLSPFYLNTAQLLFSKKRTLESLEFKAKYKEGKEKEIIALYVEETLKEMEGYNPERARKYLAFLADRIGKRGLLQFELGEMQYDWGVWSRTVSCVIGVIAGFVEGLVVSLGFSIIFGVALILVFNFLKVIFFVGVIIIALIMTLEIKDSMLSSMPRISLKDKVNWSCKKLISSFFDALKVFSPFGLFMLLLDVLPGYSFIYEIIFALLYVSVPSIVVSLIYLVLGDYSSYLKVNTPYKRFYGSIKLLHFSILQHFHLSYLLRKCNVVPSKYPEFLEKSAEHFILESSGGSWRFRHRILQEHFRQIWEEEYADQFPDGYQEEMAIAQEG